jgi:predicted ABC-type ATPase
MIPIWQNQGYKVKLIFLQLPDVETAISRVAARVRQGGHDIPPETIARRFAAGLRNFHEVYKPLVDMWLHFDNAGDTPNLLDWREK